MTPEPVPPSPARRRAETLLFGIHAGLYLLPRLPVTLARLVRSLLPGRRVPRGEFFAFGPVDATFRAWYAKIAVDQARVGRTGFVWDDGFGLPMNPRFYNNRATFALYGFLGARAFGGLALLLLSAVAFLLFARSGSAWAAAGAALLLAGSPLVLSGFLHRGKPEMVWWPFVALMAGAALEGRWGVAGALFSVVAFVNFPAAFLAGVAAVLLALFWWPGISGLAALALWMLPGLAKTALRLVPFVRSGLVGSLVTEQANAAGGAARSPAARLRELASRGYVLYALLFLGAAALASLHGAGWRGAALAAAALLVFFAGQKLIVVNDPQSFWAWHLALLVPVAAHASGAWGLVALALFCYGHPRLYMLDPPHDAGRPAGLGPFPYLRPVARAEVLDPVRRLFAPVGEGARVLMETRGSSREVGGFRTFLLAAEEVLPPRGAELLPDEYSRAFQPRFSAGVLARFNAAAAPAEASRIARVTGASWALAATPAFAALLREDGWDEAASLDARAVGRETAELLQLPLATLTLLRAPFTAAIVEPPPPEVRRRGNTLAWVARADETYRVRYAWHPDFRARQGAHALAVEPDEVEPGTDLRFMRIRAAADGPLALTFRGGWL